MGIGNIAIGNISTSATLNNRIAEMRNCAYIQYPATNIQSDVGRWMLPALSYFFGSDAPENVMLERFWTAKELRLGSAHSHSGVEETARLIDKYT